MKLIAAILVNLLLTLPALAASHVWEVKSGDSIAYLGGTCHALRDSDFPLPSAFDRAYRQAGAVVFETDIGEMETPEFQQKMMAGMIHHDGRSLQDDLSPQAYRALKAYCEKLGFQVTALHPMKPPLVVLTLVSYELQKLGVTRNGVDHFYYTQAKADRKRTEGLETAEEQLGFLTVLGKGLADELIEHSLAELDRMGEIFTALLEAWKRGDEEELYLLLAESTRKDSPEIYQELFVARNGKWLPRIETLLATPQTELVLVGAGHLVGPDGLIESLKKKGYEVRQLD